MFIELRSNGPDDTMAIARALGGALRPGDVVALSGDLGAGKTVFCKGVGEALGIDPGRIVSPSFTIVTVHEGRMPLSHVDVYRLSSEREAEEIGLPEILEGNGASVVEWAEKVEKLLPNRSINITFTILEGDGRLLKFTSDDAPRLRELLSRFKPFTPGG